MIYYFLKNKIERIEQFPRDVTVFRGSKLKLIPKPYRSFDHFKITKFAGRLIMEGAWRQQLFEDGLDRSRFHHSFPYHKLQRRWEPLPFRKDRFRCFLAQDIQLGNKEKRVAYQKFVESFLEYYKETIVVKPHPVHIYKGAITSQSIWWGNLCKRLGIPYEAFSEKGIAEYAQTISMYSTGCRWSPHSDNIVLRKAPLLCFFGARYIENIEEADQVLSIEEQEAEWRKTRFCWLICNTTFQDRTINLNLVKKILRYYYDKEPLDDFS